MASLKSRRKKQEEVEQIVAESVTSTPVTEEVPAGESKYLNDAEQKALAAQNEKDEADSKKVSIEKMEQTVTVVSDMFGLSDKGFSVTGFSDKGNKSLISMTNGEVDLTITIKDNEKFGIL